MIMRELTKPQRRLMENINSTWTSMFPATNVFRKPPPTSVAAVSVSVADPGISCSGIECCTIVMFVIPRKSRESSRVKGSMTLTRRMSLCSC